MVGLMKDPRPLVQHVYEMQVEYYLNEIRTRGHGSSIDTGLFKSLHAESTVRVVDHPVHNKYINYYNHDHRWGGDPADTTPVYFRSRLYHFWYMRLEVVLENHLSQREEIPPCAINIESPHEAVSDTLLSICNKIFTHQGVSDLWMVYVTCNSLTPPRLIKPVTLFLWGCKFRDVFVEKILCQLFGCRESLRRLELMVMDLEPFESLLNELLEDLVAHHQRKREEGLAQRWLWLRLEGNKKQPTNLSEEFKEKWRKQCQKVDSIVCKIGDD